MDDGRVTDEDELRALYPPVLGPAAAKVLDRLTPEYAAFVAASPFVVIATQGPRGVDVTPRGDPPGFVTVEDARTLLIPDRRGNNRLDTLSNLLRDARIGLLFLVPGTGETVRITGTAEIRRDPALRARFALEGKEPVTVLRVTVGQVYYHCAKSILRSRLWDPAAWPAPGTVPTVGQLYASGKAAEDAGAFDAAYAERQKLLY